MKLKSKIGFRTGKTINHRITVDDNALLCVMVASAGVVASAAIDGVSDIMLRVIDGCNERKLLKTEYKLENKQQQRQQRR